MQQKIPLVHFSSVTRIATSRQPPAVIFDRITLTLPTNHICAVLGKPGSGRTTFLRLISGAERPDAGIVLTQCRFSIIANGGSYFHPMMTGIENIKLAARVYGINAESLTEMALSLSHFGSAWQQNSGNLVGRTKRSMEAIVAALLPFECYLLDDAERLPPEILALLFEILSRRQAGIIFTAQNAKFAREFANCASIIQHHSVYAYESVEEALRTYA